MGKRVLLVEDEPNIAEAIRFVLTRGGWQVETHADGRTALDRIRKAEADVIVLDVMLPGRSGFDILRDLRADERTAGLPVLMLTARGQRKDREIAEAYGANRYLTKPFANAEVLAAIEALAGGPAPADSAEGP